MDWNGDLEKELEEYLKQSSSSDDSSLDVRNLNKEMEDMSLLLSDTLSGGDSLSSPVITKQSKFLKTIKKEQLNIKNLKTSNQDVGKKDVNNGATPERNDKKDDVACKDGKDTLEEKKDKERFFTALEEKHNSPLNYSLLNKNFNLDMDTLPSCLKSLNELDDINQESLEPQETNEECLKSGGDSRSDQSSEKKLRILEAINKISLNSSTSDSLENTKDSKVVNQLLQQATSHKINARSNIIPTEKTESGLKTSSADVTPSYSREDSHQDLMSSHHAEVLKKIELERELHRIEEDYFELKNTNQNNHAAVESIGDGGKGIKGTDRDVLQVKVLELEAQLKHQELLLKGYQEENEKLYQQLKKNNSQKQEENNSSQDRIAQENFKLKNELESLRSQATSEQQLQNIREDSAMKKLSEELKAALSLNAELTEEMNILKMDLKGKQKVPKAEVLRNANNEKVKQLKKSLIPTLASRWQVSVPSSKRDGLLQYLENKVGLLEGELKRKNEEGDKALRLLERNFIDVKTQYQEYLSYLEEQLKNKQVDEQIDEAGFCPDPICRAKMRNYEISITNLKKELQQLRESNKNNEKALKLDLERFLQESESSKKLIKENFELNIQISSMENKYEADLKAIRSIQSSTLAAQETRTRQLEEELRKSNSKLENLSLVTKNCSQLEMQVSKLKEDLKEAKKNHSPKMKHWEEMNEKINNMKLQLNRRDQHLDGLLKPSPMKHGLDQSYDILLKEVEARHEDERSRWRMLVLEKVNEIQYFKQQLDIVLDFVKKLKQGGAIDAIEFTPPSDVFRKFIS